MKGMDDIASVEPEEAEDHSFFQLRIRMAQVRILLGAPVNKRASKMEALL